jgi:hypothetical protein
MLLRLVLAFVGGIIVLFAFSNFAEAVPPGAEVAPFDFLALGVLCTPETTTIGQGVCFGTGPAADVFIANGLTSGADPNENSGFGPLPPINPEVNVKRVTEADTGP